MYLLYVVCVVQELIHVVQAPDGELVNFKCREGMESV